MRAGGCASRERRALGRDSERDEGEVATSAIALPRVVLAAIEGEDEIGVLDHAPRTDEPSERRAEIDHPPRARSDVARDDRSVRADGTVERHGVRTSAKARRRPHDAAEAPEGVRVKDARAAVPRERRELAGADEIPAGGDEPRARRCAHPDVRVSSAKRSKPDPEALERRAVGARFVRRVHLGVPAETPELGEKPEEMGLDPAPSRGLELSKDVYREGHARRRCERRANARHTECTSTPRMSRPTLDIAAAAARHLLGAAAGLALIPILGRALGAEALGAWTLLGTASFVLGIADLGLTTSVQRAVAAGDIPAARRAIGLAVAAIALVAPTLAIGAIALFDVSLPASLPSARAATVTALAGGVVAALAFPYRGYVLVRGGMRALALARGAASATQLVVTLGVLSRSPSLFAPALGVLAAAIVETTLIVRAARAIDRDAPLRPRAPHSARELRQSLGEGAATLVVNVSFLVALRVDVLVIADVAPLAIVAAYGIASRAVDQAYVLAKQVSAGLLPRLAGAREREDAVRTGTAAMTVFVAAGMPALALCGGPLLVAWGGPPARDATTMLAVALLGLAAIVAASQEVAAAALTVAGRSPWSTARALAAGTVVNVALTLGGAKVVGVWAVAAATIAGNAVTAVLVWRSLRPLLSWSRATLARALAPLVAALATSVLASMILSPVAARGAGWSVAACALVTALGLLAGLASATFARARPRAPVEATS